MAGMVLCADGGRFTSKPDVASGQCIARMSNHCAGCREQPAERTGSPACPITTLYRYFLDQHEAELKVNPRTAQQVLSRLNEL